MDEITKTRSTLTIPFLFLRASLSLSIVLVVILFVQYIHPMQHPIHIHGLRFLILSQDGKANDNLVWKDTVLVPTGSSIDILLVTDNPGLWLMYYQILEHREAGMESLIKVT